MSVRLRRVNFPKLPAARQPFLRPYLFCVGKPSVRLFESLINCLDIRPAWETAKSCCADAFCGHHRRRPAISTQVATFNLPSHYPLAVCIAEKTRDVPLPEFFQRLMFVCALQVRMPFLQLFDLMESHRLVLGTVVCTVPRLGILGTLNGANYITSLLL